MGDTIIIFPVGTALKEGRWEIVPDARNTDDDDVLQ